MTEHKQMMQEIHASFVQLEAALRDAQRSNVTKVAFLANMIHEMRAPLNAVIGDISRLDEVIRHWARDKELENRDDSSCRESKIDRIIAEKGYVGLNSKNGIISFGGDEDTYLQVLRSFAVNTRSLLDSIENVGEDALADYAVVVHGIKGSARCICADMIGDFAETLEKVAKAGDFEYVAAHNRAFLDAAWKLIHDLDDMFRELDSKISRPIKEKPDGEMLLKLLSACENYDMEGVDAVMAEIDRWQYEADDGLAVWLRENVDMMNFKKIAEKLSGFNNEEGGC